jgi:hypothetical protein
MGALQGAKAFTLAKVVAFGALMVVLAVQVGPARAGTVGGSIAGHYSIAGHGFLGENTGPYVGTKGAKITVAVDNYLAGGTFVSCRITLSSSKRGGVFYDARTKAPSDTWCPTTTFKVIGDPGDVENIIVQMTVNWIDPLNGPESGGVYDILELGTVPYAPLNAG